MLSDLKAYVLHIQMLEIINIITYAIIVTSATLVGLFLFKKIIFAFIAFLISLLVGYFIYSMNQLTADKHKLQIDIYSAIVNKQNQL